jgi:hypothetical protein
MQRIPLSEVTPERLAELAEPAIIVGPDGKTLGYFQPQPQPPYDPSLIPEMSEEEWDRRVRAGGRPLADYLAEVER